MNRKFIINFFILVISTTIAGMGLELVPQQLGSPLSGSASYSFYRDSTFVELKIVTQLTNNSLQFIKRDDETFKAQFRIVATIYQKKNLVESVELIDSIILEEFKQTNSNEPMYAGELSIIIPQGKFRLILILEDLNAKTKAFAYENIEVPNARMIGLSSLWLFVPETDSVLISHNVIAYWESLGVAAITYDIPDDIQAHIKLKSSKIRTETYTATFKEKDGKKVVYGFIPISMLESGDYYAFLILYGDKGKKYTEQMLEFSLTQTTKSMLKYHFNDLIEQLEIIADTEDMKAFQEADSTQRDSLWEEFWKKMDPTPSTERNESLEEFLRRIHYVDVHFSTSIIPGWQTDRGKIYIIYGQPDEIEDHPFEIGAYPYQIWYYYKQGLTFVFVDSGNDGNYRLVESR